MDPSYLPLCVYPCRVIVQGVSPPSWRRLLVRSAMSLATLHVTLQTVFAWSEGHRHGFHIHGREYGSARLGGSSFDGDARHVPRVALRLHRGEPCSHIYNFSAPWVYDLRLEAIAPLDPRRVYPVCAGGKHAAPPEDSGRDRPAASAPRA